ncbi:nitrite reductase small subunit NirD [Dyella nitratireducens]|uniref:Nitrite reductase small subunit n=1 Tax=Dyella nitratireducens TaxID=1849580 RepID=A0ABQ1GVL5_9GAMM|nr:nitrite reductase small subunit NirD [Dyella nitratireducens]GGA50817.1 nitrite reductase small subunit [Dyella nitratireducens]GLQ42644.1 nitrite reductase small subunit [Dyella nitratireducens]
MEDVVTAKGWTLVCDLDDIVSNTGVCALVDDEQVAVFRVGENALYAIDNFDPNANAYVLSRGLIGSLGERVVVASPIYKQHFDLRTGECLEAPEHSVRAWQVTLQGDHVLLGQPLR